MSQWAKFRQRLLSGQSDRNITFSEMSAYLTHLGFAERIKGDHHIFSKEGVAELVNLQPRQDGTAKSYQVRQVRGLIVGYKLGADIGGESDDQI